MNFDALREGRTLVLGFGREGRALERAVAGRVPEARVEVLCDRMPGVAPKKWPIRTGTPEALARTPDRVLRSPGVPARLPGLARWRAEGVEITCISSLWFGARPKANVIAVTGSKGKSTTAALIAHMLSAEGKTVALGGNIGVPMLDLLDARPDWFVVELSSYQLADLQGHASVAVITRLFPEHQDWHGGVERYYADKLRIIDLVGEAPVWINAGDRVLAEAVAGKSGIRAVNLEGEISASEDGIRHRGQYVLAAADSPLPGRHNLDNLALAIGVVDSIAGRTASALKSLASFRPLPHRLERMPGPANTIWFNDSIATTPYATLAALQAIPASPVLIVGGMERGADWQMVVDYCLAHPLAGLIGLPDNGPAVCRRFVEAGAVDPARVQLAHRMQEAVAYAWHLSESGGAVLLSPGAPSFPHFRDFEHRGGMFAQALRQLVARMG